ncbi:hypothetical protein E0G79_20570 [Salmonella enterica]|nr:hypothetical protein [Salmonella enterica]EBA9765773.1 hypothetical protein [Salmonella enterica]
MQNDESEELAFLVPLKHVNHSYIPESEFSPDENGFVFVSTGTAYINLKSNRAYYLEYSIFNKSGVDILKQEGNSMSGFVNLYSPGNDNKLPVSSAFHMFLKMPDGIYKCTMKLLNKDKTCLDEKSIKFIVSREQS